jgi:Domain of unknown function (DUF1707)/Cell wall-active antibiotics response 4TMS YvqF
VFNSVIVESVDDLPIPVPTSKPPFSPRDLRASDIDRDRVADVLREALVQGRLTVAEHAERIDAVYRAKTVGELEPLTRDLPTNGYPAAPPAKGTLGSLLSTLADPASVVALFGESKRSGAWVVGPEITATAVFGSVRLDFREAIFQQREVVVIANVLCGSIEIEVPEGADVREEGFAICSNIDVRRSGSPVPGAPLIWIKGVSAFGSVECRRPRRLWRGELRHGRWPTV